ncbi:hypothetical protein GGX14DRAFT_604855 [Mycena pura]|uniref:Uncharacterized protein n=1 Tax=Mycena pura TaxID=153505 RepID=A0AAD6YIM3_9AGAR|nr:hypothetical protein GGX14DRAFT_604855 [Mycena pura]
MTGPFPHLLERPYYMTGSEGGAALLQGAHPRQPLVRKYPVAQLLWGSGPDCRGPHHATGPYKYSSAAAVSTIQSGPLGKQLQSWIRSIKDPGGTYNMESCDTTEIAYNDRYLLHDYRSKYIDHPALVFRHGASDIVLSAQHRLCRKLCDLLLSPPVVKLEYADYARYDLIDVASVLNTVCNAVYLQYQAARSEAPFVAGNAKDTPIRDTDTPSKSIFLDVPGPSWRHRVNLSHADDITDIFTKATVMLAFTVIVLLCPVAGRSSNAMDDNIADIFTKATVVLAFTVIVFLCSRFLLRRAAAPIQSERSANQEQSTVTLQPHIPLSPRGQS